MWDINDFKNLEPERYYDNPSPKTSSLTNKKQDILNNKDNLYIATEKNDGCWAMLIHYDKGHNLIRSRGISKTTNEYGDFTPLLPHIAAEMDKLPPNTCLLGEICWARRGSTSNEVDVILHCLPEKAIQRQSEIGRLHVVVFDCLMFLGQSLDKEGYENRLTFAEQCVSNCHSNYIHLTNIYQSDFLSHAQEIFDSHGEGLVIQRRDALYEPGKRTAWKSLKYKQSINTLDLKVISASDANVEYLGKCPSTWEYFDSSGKPITKAAYFGWKTSVTVDYQGTPCNVSSGLTEQDQQWLATPEAQALIEQGSLYAEVGAMMESANNKLRHPHVIRLRTDVV